LFIAAGAAVESGPFTDRKTTGPPLVVVLGGKNWLAAIWAAFHTSRSRRFRLSM
jgi:hypothetical protein